MAKQSGQHHAGLIPISESVRRRFQAQPRRDTACELALRRVLHRLGLRYTLDDAPLPGLRRRADVVFRRARVAVFVDGCFWHGCSEHRTIPANNRKWWQAKITANQQRDRDTDERLTEDGWLVVRVWEHDEPTAAAQEIATLVRQRLVNFEGERTDCAPGSGTRSSARPAPSP